MKRSIRYIVYVLTGLVGLAIVAVIVITVGGAVVLETTVPDYGGRDSIPQLGGQVTVIRDANAVPHIFADSPLDAYRALGYLHAQDRFFQMELARRIGTGRLSELVGATGLRIDRFMRTLGIGRLAEAAVINMAPATLETLDAYTEGVNAWLQSPHTGRPPELIFLGVTPEPWRAADSAIWGRLMALLLSGNWTDELLRAQLASRLDAQQIDDLWPGEPSDSPTTLASVAGLIRQIDFAGIERAIPDFLFQASASNQWVVDGNRSATGKPMLANDPHLGFMAPGMWYLARIVTPTFSGAGATLPGQPFFAVGHNSSLAWGFTTTHADTQDLFIERLNPDDPSQYLVPGGSLPFETRQEVISVRFRSEPEILTVRSTRHGPVISDLSVTAASVAPAGHVVALAFPALRPDDRTADALFGINRAKTRSELMTALALFHSPMQNLVYAFTNGDIGFVAPARVPIRRSGDGRTPVPGWSGNYDWEGFVPFAELPQRHNPSTGWIANANNRVVGKDYPHLITPDWPEGYRAQRITTLLDQTAKHDSDSFALMQGDIVSPAAQQLTPLLLRHLAPPVDPIARTAAALLADWDGAMARSQPQPLIFTAWLRSLGSQLYGDELGPMASRYGGIRPRVLQRMLNSRTQWCDDIDTPAIEDCTATVSTAFEKAIGELSERLGDAPAAWRWGELHVARFEHPVLRRIPVLRDLFAVAIPTSGGDFTISRGTPRSTRASPFTHVHGAGLRAIFDLSDLDSSRLMIATGQSGHVRSEFFADTTPGWRDGRYLVLKGDPAALRKETIGELTLVP
ncbi:MAG: penicillin acylase family protein [Alphaproteobacteria bacterium]|nr:penicillin acylase family protein [Alphaproteobacteria bacterium]